MYGVTHTPGRWAWLSLCAVIAVAALMRLSALGVVEFSHDEATLSLLALDFARGGPLPLTGMQSSVGIPNSPASVYVMALPYLFTDDPLIATGFVAALNVIGVGLLWLLVFRYAGFWPALVAGLIYAFNIWAVLYSRKVWAQDFHTPFLTLALLLGLYGFGEQRGWAQVACLPVLLFAAQIHFAAWTFVPLYLLLLVLFRRNIIWPLLIVSVVVGAITLLPFAVGLLNTLSDDPQRLSGAFTGPGLMPSIEPFRAAIWFATGTGLEHVVAPLQTEDFRRAVSPQSLLWIGVLGSGVMVGTAQLWRTRRQLALLIIAWAIVPVLFFLPGWTEVYPHYFIGSIPAFCVLVAFGVILFPVRAMRWALTVAVSATLLTQLSCWGAVLQYVDTTFTPDGFGTPLHFMRDVRDKLPIRDNVLVIADGFDLRYDREPAVWSVLLHDTAQCVRTLAGQELTLYPAQPLTVLVAPDALSEMPLNLVFHNPLHRVPLRSGEGVYSIYQVFSLPSPSDLAFNLIQNGLFDSRVRLIGYKPATDHTALVWSLPGRININYQFFVHYLDAADTKLKQTDRQFWPGYHWCAGDILITQAASPPPGTIRMRVGLYTLAPNGAYTNAALIDDAGIPVASWVDISLAQP